VPDNKQNAHMYYLLGFAELNDSLLQAYRNLHLTLQSIFMVLGAGLLVAVLHFNEALRSTLAACVLVALGIISTYILFKIRGIIIARGKDVSYWHCELIKAEQGLPPDRRYFTQFKIYQKLQRSKAEYLRQWTQLAKGLTDEEIRLLVETGLGHTRKILDKWLFIAIVVIWLLLAIIGIGYTIYTYVRVP